jgi:hypothetical protein
MSFKSGYEHVVGLVIIGAFLVGFTAAWDYLIYAVNVMDMMGYQSQDAMNTVRNLSIIFNAIPFLYVIASAFSIINDGKRDRRLQQ